MNTSWFYTIRSGLNVWSSQSRKSLFFSLSHYSITPPSSLLNEADLMFQTSQSWNQCCQQCCQHTPFKSMVMFLVFCQLNVIKKKQTLWSQTGVSDCYLQTVTLTPSLLSPLLSFSFIHSILLSPSLWKNTQCQTKSSLGKILILCVWYRWERKKEEEWDKKNRDGRGRQREEHSETERARVSAGVCVGKTCNLVIPSLMK